MSQNFTPLPAIGIYYPMSIERSIKAADIAIDNDNTPFKDENARRWVSHLLTGINSDKISLDLRHKAMQKIIEICVNTKQIHYVWCVIFEKGLRVSFNLAVVHMKNGDLVAPQEIHIKKYLFDAVQKWTNDHTNILKYLADNKHINVNKKIDDSNPLIFYAIKIIDVFSLKTLINTGIDCDIKDNQGRHLLNNYVAWICHPCDLKRRIDASADKRQIINWFNEDKDTYLTYHYSHFTHREDKKDKKLHLLALKYPHNIFARDANKKILISMFKPDKLIMYNAFDTHLNIILNDYISDPVVGIIRKHFAILYTARR